MGKNPVLICSFYKSVVHFVFNKKCDFGHTPCLCSGCAVCPCGEVTLPAVSALPMLRMGGALCREGWEAGNLCPLNLKTWEYCLKNRSGPKWLSLCPQGVRTEI